MYLMFQVPSSLDEYALSIFCAFIVGVALLKPRFIILIKITLRLNQPCIYMKPTGSNSSSTMSRYSVL